MGRRQGNQRVARRAEQLAGTATGSAGAAVGGAAQRAGAAVQRAGSALDRHGTASAPAVGTAVGAAVGTALELADSAAATTAETATRVGRALTGAASGFADTVGGIVDEPAVRSSAALDALRGSRVGPPLAVRRWPWALGAAVAGAAAGAAVAALFRRIEGQDAPGAQEPQDLRAVVDLPVDAPDPAYPSGQLPEAPPPR